MFTDRTTACHFGALSLLIIHGYNNFVGFTDTFNAELSNLKLLMPFKSQFLQPGTLWKFLRKLKGIFNSYRVIFIKIFCAAFLIEVFAEVVDYVS